jgi:hypothetical protein
LDTSPTFPEIMPFLTKTFASSANAGHDMIQIGIAHNSLEISEFMMTNGWAYK